MKGEHNDLPKYIRCRVGHFNVFRGPDHSQLNVAEKRPSSESSDTTPRKVLFLRIPVCLYFETGPAHMCDGGHSGSRNASHPGRVTETMQPQGSGRTPEV